VAGLRLIVLGEKRFNTFDYGTAHTFKLYTVDAGSGEVAFNATSYTGYVKFFNEAGGELITELSPSWTTQSSGIGTFQFTGTNNLNTTTAGSHDTIYVEVQLEKSGVLLSSNRVPITVTASPTGTRLP
jgi:hypothetical protein